MIVERKTKILLPAGEWLESLLQLFSTVGIKYERESQRNYFINFPEFDIEGTLVRTNSVPLLLQNDDVSAVAGFTGTDILFESETQKDGTVEEWSIPFDSIGVKAPQPKIYIGTTPNAQETFGEHVRLEDILTGIIATVYPRILETYINKMGYSEAEVRIHQDKGKIEGLWRILPGCFAICDVVSTGKTMKENGIDLFESIMLVQLAFVQNNEKTTTQDLERIEKLKRKILRGH